jgi:hypothetical protein
MKKNIKKILSVFVIVAFVSTTFLLDTKATSFVINKNHNIDLSQYLSGQFDLDVHMTYVNLSVAPDNVDKNKFVVIGDSYAVLYGMSCLADVDYVAHAGYNVSKINNELVPLIPENYFEYAYVCIGPNDFMEQTALNVFEHELKKLIYVLKIKNITPIFSDYNPVDLMLNPHLKHLPIKSESYNSIIKKVVGQYALPFISVKDLSTSYGYDSQGIHYNCVIYPPLHKRVSAYINSLEEQNKHNHKNLLSLNK